MCKMEIEHPRVPFANVSLGRTQGYAIYDALWSLNLEAWNEEQAERNIFLVADRNVETQKRTGAVQNRSDFESIF